jgi:hypothetical protein
LRHHAENAEVAQGTANSVILDILVLLPRRIAIFVLSQPPSFERPLNSCSQKDVLKALEQSAGSRREIHDHLPVDVI